MCDSHFLLNDSNCFWYSSTFCWGVSTENPGAMPLVSLVGTIYGFSYLLPACRYIMASANCSAVAGCHDNLPFASLTKTSFVVGEVPTTTPFISETSPLPSAGLVRRKSL